MTDKEIKIFLKQKEKNKQKIAKEFKKDTFAIKRVKRLLNKFKLNA